MKPSTGYGISLLAQVDDSGKPVKDESKITCELVAAADGTFEISKAGKLSGHFQVPAEGNCFQQEETRMLGPGRYHVLIGCHTCQLAVLRVTRA